MRCQFSPDSVFQSYTQCQVEGATLRQTTETKYYDFHPFRAEFVGIFAILVIHTNLFRNMEET